MSSLWFGFYGEGKRDYGFLQPLIQRILDLMLPQVDIFLLTIELSEKGLSQTEKIKQVAQKANGYNFVIFHLDADASDTEKAYQERFLPGYQQLDPLDKHLNRDLIPLIPVRMTDAWLLVDAVALNNVIQPQADLRTLGVPEHPQQIESISDPKSIFDATIRQSKISPLSLPDIYDNLAAEINLARLEQVPAYQEFKTRLIQTLKEQHYL